MQPNDIHKFIRKLHNIHLDLKEGWQEYNLYFYIGGISVIIGGFMHVAGATALIITLIFFYYAGKFHLAIKNRRKKKINKK